MLDDSSHKFTLTYEIITRLFLGGGVRIRAYIIRFSAIEDLVKIQFTYLSSEQGNSRTPLLNQNTSTAFIKIMKNLKLNQIICWEI